MSSHTVGAPYAQLTPNCILNALGGAGFRCDGRLLALNCYENRVYPIGMEDGLMRVVKFYRPERWNSAAILEAHGFMRELAEADLPVVAPLANDEGATPHEFERFRFAVFPWQGGYAPEFAETTILEHMGNAKTRGVFGKAESTAPTAKVLNAW